MEGSYFTVLAYSGCCYLQALLDLSARHWYLLGPPLWLFGATFFWRSCSSRSWFCLVRCSTTAARVWTYLSRAVVGGSSSRMSLVVAIERVSTMQLFRPGSNNTAYELQRIVSFPIDDANWWSRKSHQWATWYSHTRNNTCIARKGKTLTDSTSVVPAKYPPKVKLESLTTPEC